MNWQQVRACSTACACAVFSILSIASGAAHADVKPGVESFFSDPTVYNVVLSPKGGHVAMLMKDSDGGQLIAVRDTADPRNGKIVAGSKGDQIIAIHWVNENRITFTVRAAIHDIYGGNNDEIAVDRDGQNLVHLISGDFRHVQDNIGTHIKSRILTSDYAFAAALHDGSDDILVRQYHWNQTDLYFPENSHLFRLNTRTLELKDVPIGKSPEMALGWMMDGHDVPRIAHSRKGGRCQVYYRPAGSDNWEALAEDDCITHDFNMEAFDGDDRLIVSKSYKGYNALYHYDLKAKKLDAEPFLSLDGFDFSGSVETDDVTNKAIGIHFESDAASTAWLDPKYKQIQAKVDALLPQTANRISCAQDCLNAQTLLVTAGSDRQPTKYLIYNIEKNSLVEVGGAHPEIKPAQMGMRDFYRFKARDGMVIPVYVTVPPGKPARPLPTVVLVHGGPWTRGSFWEWDSEAQFLASRGYMVIQPEFRGSEGFGYNLFHAGWRQYGQAMQDDLADAALWAVREHGADPKRIGIMGASYGGYATLMGLIKNPEIFRCGVEWAGVTDLNLMFSLAENDSPVNSLKYDQKVLVGDPKGDEEMFHKYSPLEHAAKLSQPLLIAHGADDKRVPIAQATAFRDAVVKTNPHVEWIVYNNEGHGWHLEKDSIDFWSRVDAFLDKNLMNAK
jgi:acetyl esterase/lipase